MLNGLLKTPNKKRNESEVTEALDFYSGFKTITI